MKRKGLDGVSARGRAFRPDDLAPVQSVCGHTLNMTWLVDAIELAIRERSTWPLRMWLHFKAR